VKVFLFTPHSPIWIDAFPESLVADSLADYPADLNCVGANEEDCFKKIEQAMSDGWNPKRIRTTYRWCAIEFSESLLDISDSHHRKEARSFPFRVLRRALATLAPSWEQHSDQRNRAPWLACASRINQVIKGSHASVLDPKDRRQPLSSPAETDLLKGRVRALLEALYGRAPSNPGKSLAEKLHGFCN